MATYQQVSMGYPDGAQIGDASTDKIGLLGAVPVTQSIASLATQVVGTLSTYQVSNLTTAQLSALVTNQNAIITGLKAYGLMAP